MNEIRIYDIFTVVANDKKQVFEFKPKFEAYDLYPEFKTYTISYSECDNEQDACIAVWKSILEMRKKAEVGDMKNK